MLVAMLSGRLLARCLLATALLESAEPVVLGSLAFRGLDNVVRMSCLVGRLMLSLASFCHHRWTTLDRSMLPCSVGLVKGIPWKEPVNVDLFFLSLPVHSNFGSRSLATMLVAFTVSTVEMNEEGVHQYVCNSELRSCRPCCQPSKCRTLPLC